MARILLVQYASYKEKLAEEKSNKDFSSKLSIKHYNFLMTLFLCLRLWGKCFTAGFLGRLSILRSYLNFLCTTVVISHVIVTGVDHALDTFIRVIHFLTLHFISPPIIEYFFTIV